MAYVIDLEKYDDERGTLTVIDKVLPFEIKRSYYMFLHWPITEQGIIQYITWLSLNVKSYSILKC